MSYPKTTKSWVRWLKKFGIELVEELLPQTWLLRCEQCGGSWNLLTRPGGGFYRNWRLCPHHRCNEDLLVHHR